MVKIGKLFSKKIKGLAEDATVAARLTGKTSPSPTPETQPSPAPFDTPAAALAEPAPHIATDSATATATATAVSHSASLASKSRKSKSRETVEETRDEPPSNDPVDPDSTPSDADDQSFEASVSPSEEDVSANFDGTIGTYDEISQQSTDEKSYDCDEDECTFDDTLTNQDQTTVISKQSAHTAKGDDVSKKYFHKDVVLNSLEDGSNNLVIRAMYFIPKPKAEEHVVVKIEASTISARDCMKCRGHGVTQSMLPFVPGYEIVGTIQTLGEKVKSEGQFREGDRVAAVSTFGGGNSRFISIPTDRLVKISDNVKSTQAVCMIHDYMAALKALRLAKKAGSPFTGMNLLITDGFSPVGQAIITLANLEGAEIYCCADESKHSYLASLGAKCFVKNPDSWLPSASGTFDIVIDNSCVDSYSSSWFALNQKGSLVCLAPIYNIDVDEMPRAGCGLVEMTELQQKWAGLKAKYMMSQTSFLNTVTTYDDDNEQYKQDMRYLMFILERGDIKPKVAERVSLDDVPDAQRLMQSGRANGTVVCVPWIEE